LVEGGIILLDGLATACTRAANCGRAPMDRPHHRYGLTSTGRPSETSLWRLWLASSS